MGSLFHIRRESRDAGDMTTETQCYAMGDSIWKWHATAADTGGMFSLAEIVARPGGEPPAHIHSREDEAMLVLEGDVDFRVGAKRIHASSGQLVVMPRGVEHGFSIASDRTRLLLICTPGGLEQALIASSQPHGEFALPVAPAGPPPAEAIEHGARTLAQAGVQFVS